MEYNGNVTELKRFDRELSFGEVLQFYQNMFKQSLVANIIDLRHYESIKKYDPSYATINQMGQRMTVNDLIESHQKGARNAKANLEYVSQLIADEKAGTLDASWSDEILTRKQTDLVIPALETPGK